MNKQEILEELKIQFETTKKNLGFKSTFEEINKVSYIEDMALSHGFVSNQLSRQLANRMVETYYNWVGEIHAWVYPAPGDLIHANESKQLSQEERKELFLMLDRIMYLTRKVKRIAFKGLIKNEEADFIDELTVFNKKYFNPFMLKFHEKFEKVWIDEVSKQEKN